MGVGEREAWPVTVKERGDSDFLSALCIYGELKFDHTVESE